MMGKLSQIRVQKIRSAYRVVCVLLAENMRVDSLHGWGGHTCVPVSYTHLTLPTILRV